VTVAVGARRLVVPEALELAFATLSEGGPAEGARLRIEEVPLAARCRACGTSYAPRIDDYRCPGCARAEPEITAGNDILLTSLTGDDGS
jgi:hydrogenase nickel incorporation protein HypA/HybF